MSFRQHTANIFLYIVILVEALIVSLLTQTFFKKIKYNKQEQYFKT